jgi:polyisoprenoid-binding protein YceI
MRPPLRRATLIAGLLAVVAACAPPPPLPPAAPAEAPPSFPHAHYRQALERGAEVLRVDPARSRVAVEVRRDGALAALGHDHVVASHDLHGYVAPAEGRADLYLDLFRLAVDEPGLRAETGLDTHPSAEAVEGTRRNMLGKVLEAERHPHALIRIHRHDTRPGLLDVAITLHGATRTYAVPAAIETRPDGLAVSGTLSFNQTDFGIIPLSVLGGALQVRDRLDLRFRVHAARVTR